MKYDIKPNHQLITFLYDTILLELVGVYFPDKGSNVIMRNSLKVGTMNFNIAC